MGEVIDFPSNELKHCGYYDFEGSDSGVSVSMLDESLAMVSIGDGLSIQVISDEGHSIALAFSREELAEFLHVASCLIDSEQRFMPRVDLIGKNYD